MRPRMQPSRDELIATGAKLPIEDFIAIAEGRIDSRCPIVQAVSWFLMGEKNFLVVSADLGTGKTFGTLAAAARHYAPTVWWAGRDLDAWCEASVALPDDSVLVVDDLGVEPASPRDTAALDLLVTRRMTRRTIITTTLAPSELRGRYGARLGDRIGHVGSIVRVEGPSRRRGAAW